LLAVDESGAGRIDVTMFTHPPLPAETSAP